MRIYHNPRCSKSREARQLCEDAGVELEIVEYLKTPPDEVELKELLGKLGLKLMRSFVPRKRCIPNSDSLRIPMKRNCSRPS